MIKLLLVDDEERIRYGWRMRLALEPDILIVGETDNGESAITLAMTESPNLIILDINLVGQDGLTTTRKLREVLPEGQIIVVTIYDTPSNRTAAFEAGAAAFVAKQESPERLITTIRELTNNPK